MTMKDQYNNIQQPARNIPLWRQMRWNLVLYSIILVALPILALGYITINQVRERTISDAFTRLDNIATLKAQQVQEWLERGNVVFDTFLADSGNRNQLIRLLVNGSQNFSGESANRLLSNQVNGGFVENYPFSDLLVYNLNGDVVAASSSADIGKVVKRQPYFSASLSDNHLQSPYYDLSYGGLTMFITRPLVNDSGVTVGAIAARLLLDDLAEIMTERETLGESGETYLISAEYSRFLTPSRFLEKVENRAYFSQGIDRALSGENGQAIYGDYRNPPVPVLGVYRWLPELRAAFLTEIDEAETLIIFNQIASTIVVVMIVAAVVASIGAAYYASRFTTPIIRLTEVASRVAVGDLSQRAPAGEASEIGILAETFNSMSEQLQDLIDSLEGRVQARTRDLASTIEVGRLANSIYSQEELLPKLVEFIRSRFDLYYTQIYLLDEAYKYALLQAGTGEVGEQLLARKHRLNLAETSLVARAVQSGQPVVVSDTANNPTHKANPLLPDTRSEVAIPLKVGNDILGVLDLQAVRPDTFTDENAPVFEAMGAQIAAVLRGAQAYDAAQVAARQAEEANARLTSATWQSYLGSVGEGERVGYRYDLESPKRIPADEQLDGSDDGSVKPIVVRGAQIGKIVVKDDENALSQEDYVLIEDAAKRVGQALDQFRAFDEIKRSEQALRLRDQAISSSTSGITIADARLPDMPLIYVNEAFEQVTGYSFAEAVGRNCRFLQNDDRDQEGLGELRAAFKEGRDCQVTLRNYRKNGELFYNELTISPVRDDQGNITHFVGISNDVTERIRQQEALQELNIFQEAILNSANQSIISTTIDGIITSFNAAAEEMLGYKADEVVGKVTPAIVHDLDEVVARSAVLTQELGFTVEPGFDVFIAKARMGLSDENEWTYIAKDGRRFPVLLSVTPVHDDMGEITGYLGVATDITERKQAEREIARRASELETIARVSAAATTILDVDELLQTVCDLTQQNFGYYHVQIYLLDDEQSALRLAAGVGTAGRTMLERGHNIPLSREHSLVARAARERQGVISNNITQEPDFLQNPLLPDTRSELAVPMIVGTKLVGILDVQHDQVDRFKDQDVQVKTTLAEQVAVAVENARAFQLIREAQKQVNDIRFALDEHSIVAITDQRGIIQYANERFSQISEYSREELIGQDHRIINSGYHSKEFIRNLWVTIANGQVWKGEFQNKAKSGRLYWVDTTIVPFLNEEGKPRQYITIRTDITERKEAELEIARRAAELETIARVSAATTTLLDVDELLKSVSDLTKSSFGYYHTHVYLLDEEAELLRLAAGAGKVGDTMKAQGFSIPLSRPNSLVARAAREHHGVIANDVTQEPDFLPNPLLPDTRSELALPMIVANRVVGVLDVQDARPNRFTEADVRIKTALADQIAVAVENARAFKEQQQTAERLREVDKLKSQFLANMSHELRTPLNSIIGYAEVLLDGIDGDLSDEAEEDVKAIHTGGRHLLSIINDILDLAKIEAGQMFIDSRETDLVQAVNEVVNTARILASNKGLALNVQANGDVPTVLGDPIRLRQIILNLVNNSIKFTEQGSVTIAIDRHDDRSLVVRVEDTGMGLTPGEMEGLFQQFHQVDGSATRRAGGTGLGLVITRHFVEMHGGEIHVESEKGVGSTFWFTLPVYFVSPTEKPASVRDTGTIKRVTTQHLG